MFTDMFDVSIALGLGVDMRYKAICRLPLETLKDSCT